MARVLILEIILTVCLIAIVILTKQEGHCNSVLRLHNKNDRDYHPTLQALPYKSVISLNTVCAAYIAVRFTVGLFKKLQCYRFLQESSTDAATSIILRQPADCKRIIAARYIHPHGALNRLRPHKARAIPNQRLVCAFGINNCFTTSDAALCNRMLCNVVQKMSITEHGWRALADDARALVSDQVMQHDFLNLADLIQLVSMKMIRKIFWSMPPTDTENDEAIRALAKEINRQWLKSKEDCDNDALQFRNQPKLLHALVQAYPDFDNSVLQAVENPLNIMLPAYETLWRVVLRGVLEICIRKHNLAETWKEIMKNFASDPTIRTLRLQDSASTDSEVSAEMIIKEVLRLYPPTRRVHRAFKDEDDVVRFAAADIESLHRLPHWERPDVARPLVMNDKSDWPVLTLCPERWSHVSEMFEEANFMPFGATPFRCPAKGPGGAEMPFGNTMIAILIGVLVDAIDGKFTCTHDLPPIGIPLQNGREAYTTLALQKIM